MSTDYTLIDNGGSSNRDDGADLVLTERSSKFDLDCYHGYDMGDVTIATAMTAEQVVELAMKLLQPTLYNVPDPRAFMDTVIKPALEKLHI